MSRESIRARVEAATPGPWKGCAHVAGTDADCPCRYPGDIWDGSEERVIAFLGYDPKPDPSLSPRTISADDIEQGYANGRFIAHARQDIPALLAVADVMDDLLAEQFCPATSGGTEGRWCLNHDDQPMVSDTECALVQRARAALAALEAGA